MSSLLPAVPDQGRGARAVETLERLLSAAEAELGEVGHEALTIRAVALRAGVSAATAYTYLASKDQLFAELFRRRLATEAGPELTGATPAARLQQTMHHLATVIAGSPEVTAAATKSLLGADPQVQRLRLRIGAFFVERFREAIGADADPHVVDRVVEAISLAFFGALLSAGMGLAGYPELDRTLDRVVAVIVAGNL